MLFLKECGSEGYCQRHERLLHALFPGGIAKVNEIEPQGYLKFLFEPFPASQTTEDMLAVMPQLVD